VKLAGINIRKLRKMKNLTQDELSERTGHQTSFLAGVERGERNITLQTLEKIINGLDEDPKSIFNFINIDINDKELSKKEIISLLVNLLSDKEESDVKLIYNIAKDIFNNYK